MPSYRCVFSLFVFSGLLVGCGGGQTPGTTGAKGATGAEGPPGLIWMGPYSPSTQYVPTDVVSFGGSSYVAIAQSNDVAPIGAPASLADWALLAQSGANGAAGTTGATGPQGPVGPQGVPGAQGPVGAQGSIGPQGAIGPQGIAGPQGVAGPQGSTGPQGVAGTNGSTGPQGLTGATGSQGVPGVQGPIGLTGVAGPQGAIGPTGATGVAGPPGVSFLQGKGFGVLGDSIAAANQWQLIVASRTGMTLTMQDARVGRNLSQAFECYGHPAVGGTLGVFDASFPPTIYQNCSVFTQGVTNGNTLAQNLAQVDLQIIALGTNDESLPIGALGDATNAGTFYGNLRWVVETYLAAKPTMRVVLVTPAYNTFASQAAIQQCVEAMKAYGQSMGVPVIDMYALSGVNSLTSSSLTIDGTHPNTFNYTNFYGPVIAGSLAKYF